MQFFIQFMKPKDGMNFFLQNIVERENNCGPLQLEVGSPRKRLYESEIKHCHT